jgi:hypothetical protein
VTGGTQILLYNLEGERKKAGQALLTRLAPLTPGKSAERLVAMPSFYEIRSAKAMTLYCECEFHDTKEGSDFIRKNTKNIGEAIAKGICDYYGVNTEEKKTEAKEQGIEYDKKSELSMAGYAEYVQAKSTGKTTETDKYYVDFETYLEANAGEGIYDIIVKVADNIFASDAETTFASAVSDIQETVDAVTKILRILIFPVLVLAGAANMFVTVNTLPLVLDIGGVEKVGTFTGYYYTATFSAQIASPILYGFVRMFSGSYISLFYYSPVAFAIAIIMLLFVKHGEAVPDELVKKAQEEND